MSTYARLKANGLEVGNSMYFADKKNVSEAVLKEGRNKAFCEIDPFGKTPESDENNNSFFVWIVVEP